MGNQHTANMYRGRRRQLPKLSKAERMAREREIMAEMGGSSHSSDPTLSGQPSFEAVALTKQTSERNMSLSRQPSFEALSRQPSERNLSRQLSEGELNNILSVCLSNVDEKPVRRSISRDQSSSHLSLVPARGGYTVAQMVTLLTKLRDTAHLASSAIRNRVLATHVVAWKSKARQAGWPSLFHSLIQESFENADQQCLGTVNATEAVAAYRALVSRLKQELGQMVAEPLDAQELHQQLEQETASLDQITFAQYMHAVSHLLSRNAALRPGLRVVNEGVRCICGNWMTKLEKAACYHGGAVRCDFTGANAHGDCVWHCQRNRAEPVHPFGFDIAEESVEAFKQFQYQARLFERLGQAILKTGLTPTAERKLRQRREDCGRGLCDAVKNMYFSIKDDLSNVSQNGQSSALEDRLKWCKSVLEMTDWVALKKEARDELQGTLESLKGFSAELSHDKLCFKDAEHRASEIAGFDARFKPAERHEAFEKGLQQLAKVALFAKDIVGLERLDDSDPEAKELLEFMSETLLNQIMQQQGIPFVLVDSSFEVTDSGVKFKWSIGLPFGQKEFEHVVPLDKSDVEIAQLQRQFMMLYHETQERLQNLEHCATEGDLDSELNQFRVKDGDSACGELCVICQEDMCPEEAALQIKSCGHCFHDECVRGWLLGCKQECPVCKVPVNAEPKPEPEPERFAVGSLVLLTGLQNRIELNGSVGTIVVFVEDRGRYQVSVGDTTYLLSPANLVAHELSDDSDEDSEPLSLVPDEDSDEEQESDDELLAALALSLEDPEQADQESPPPSPPTDV